MEEVVSKHGKKIVKWGEGVVVFVTKEAKLLNWDTDTHVRVSVVENEQKKRRIVIEELGRV